MDDNSRLAALNTAAAASMQQGDYQAARAAFVQVVETHRRASVVDPAELARALTNLSVACAELGLDDEAQAQSSEAVDLLRDPAADHALLAAVLHNWGYAHKTANRWSAALHAFETAARVLDETPQLSPLDTATMLQEAAELLRWMQRAEDGFAVADRCMNLRHGVLGTTDPSVAQAAQLAGRLLGDTGDHAKAILYLRSAYQIFSAMLGMADGRTVEAIHDLLTAARKSGDQDTVEEDLRNLIAISRSLGTGVHPFLFRELADLAAVLDARGGQDESRAVALEAEGLLAGLSHEADDRLARHYEDLAELLTRQGEPRRAVPLLDRAFRAGDPLIVQAVTTRDRRYRRRFLSRLEDQTARIVRHVADHCADDPAAAAAAFHFVVNRKGLLAAATMAHDDDRLGACQPELQPVLTQIRELNDALIQLHAGGMLDGARKHFQQQDRLEQQLRNLNGAVEMRTRRGNAPRLPPAVRAADLAASLPPGSALVEYYAIMAPGEPGGEDGRRVLEESGDEWLLPPRRTERYVAFVMFAGGDRVTFVDLGEAAGIERLADSYLVAMSGGRRDLVPRERENDVDEASEEDLSRGLRARLFDPVAGALDGRSTLFIAPDGVVCRVPFSALIDQDGSARLLDRLTVGYVPTGRSVLAFQRPATPAGEAPVVVGDPDYDFVKPGESPEPAPAVDGFVSFHFDRLPGTADEAWRVSQLVGGRRVTGKKAHETALRECRSPAILHVASHGYYVRPFSQGLRVIGNWREFHGSMFRGEVLGFAGNPFLRSGIALAGVNAWSANRPLPAEAGDGLLTAAEIARIDLEGTELVVLSACSGALGDVMPGNGVAGLLHGFHVAGARATVASLWQIPDEITEHLMRAFYERLLQGVPRLEALRQAQRELSGTRPAWQWASYVSYGDPGPIAYRPATGIGGSD